MNELVVASTEADARALDLLVERHAGLTGAAGTLTEAVTAAASRGDSPAAADAVETLARWFRTELLPHLSAVQETLVPAARTLAEARLLVDALVGERDTINALADRVANAADPVRAAATGVALSTVVDGHVRRLDELVVPALAAAPEASLADLTAELSTLADRTATPEHAGTDEEAPAHSCGCHEAESAGYPELDARDVPHAIRHATVFGALDAVTPGRGLVLVAPHDPLPLLAQLERRRPDTFRVRYLERGPEAWRLELTRTADA